MKRPNKRAIAKAIHVTSQGYQARYFLKVSYVGTVPTYDFCHLDGVEILTFAAANALVRTMREHAYKTWRSMYADSQRAARIAAAERS